VDENRDAQVAAVAALAEPSRRRLYDHVIRQPAPVSRDEAAAAVALPRATAAFHLDRLVADGLLDVVFERRTGRTGPGAGRPSKLYRRTDRAVGVSFPERSYDLAGDLLAGALTEAEASGEVPRVVLQRRAFRRGRELAATGEGPDRVLRVLEDGGFEPRTEGAGIVLVNCPFHRLARQHAELVCDMNLHLIEGIVDGLGESGLIARPRPEAGMCCVRLEVTPASWPDPRTG
jgi:predicted ArsR family transcriptional regulator